MTLDADDKDWVRLMAKEITRAVSLEIAVEVMKAHVESCPHAKVANRRWYIFMGVICGVSLVSGGGGFALAKLIL